MFESTHCIIIVYGSTKTETLEALIFGMETYEERIRRLLPQNSSSKAGPMLGNELRKQTSPKKSTMVSMHHKKTGKSLFFRILCVNQNKNNFLSNLFDVIFVILQKKCKRREYRFLIMNIQMTRKID